jgi:hypothetical protein
MLLTPNALRKMVAFEACKNCKVSKASLPNIFLGLNLEDVSSEGLTLLMMASANGNFEVVKFLLDNGARVETTSLQGYTALDLANLVYEKTKDKKYMPVIRILDII